MGKRGIVAFLCVAASVSWEVPTSWAADNVDQFELSPEQLFDATVVSVSKTSEKLMDAPAAVFVLTNEDIMRSGATSIPEALRLVPGVQVAQIGANNWAIGVRGFNSALSNKLLVLIDGREVYDPLYAGVYWDIQDVVLEDIDHIEVIRGPGASLWGANAVDGVINIITKKAADTQGNLVSLTTGNQAHAIAEERYGGTLGNDGYYRVYGKYVDLASETTVAGINAHDGQVEERGGFRADWKDPLSSKDDFTFQGDSYNSGDGDLRALPTLTSPFSQLAQENIEAQGGNILGRWNHTVSDDSHFTLQSYVNYAARDELIIGDQRSTFDIDAQYELPSLDRNKIIFGGGYRYSYDQLTSSPYITFTDDHESTNLFSSFVQDKITLDPNTWFLTLGSKFEHNDFTGFEVEPNARLQWQPDETQTFWGSISRAVRTPSRLEEDLTIDLAAGSLGGVPAQIFLKPNTDFHSEELIAYELGYRNQLTPKLLNDVTVFYNNYSSLATVSFLTPNLTAVPFQFPITYTNKAYGDTYGIEDVVDWRVLDNLKLSGSYSLLEMNIYAPSTDATINPEAPEKQSPDQQFNARSQWDVTEKVSFDTMLYYTAAVPGFSVPDYWRLDTRLSWKIIDGLQFSLVGQNLVDTEHVEFTAPGGGPVVKIGRSVYGNLTWRY